MPKLLYILIYISTSSWCFAQSYDEKKFFHYTTSDGLTNNYITGIQQDSTGYIWVSTARGLNRFDGSGFRQLLHTSENNSIPDNTIFSMRLLPHNQLGIATDDGAQIISAKSLERKNLEIPTEAALRYWSNACRYVCADNEGNYGVSTKTGFYIFSAEGKLKKRLDYFTVKDIGRRWMMFGSHLYQMPDGNLMQENKSGFTVFDRKKFQFSDAAEYEETNSFDIIDVRNGDKRSFTSCFDFREELGWQSNVSHINNDLWAINSKNKGFYLIHIDTLTKTISCSTKKYFSDHFCSCIYSDKQKRLWIGTGEGLFMENSRPQIIYSFSIKTKNADDNFSITSLYITPDKIFAGTSKKEVLVLDKQTKQIIRRVSFDTLSHRDNAILSFQLIHPDTLWIAAPSGLAWLNIRNFTSGVISAGGLFKNYEPQFLYRDKKNNLWVGTNAINRLIYYNSHTGNFDSLTDKTNPLLKINIVNGLAEDNKGNIWISGDAIGRWNPRQQKVDTMIEYLSTQKNRKKGFAVMNDSNGDIWIMLNDDGFARITGSAPVHIRPDNLLFNSNSTAFFTLLQDKIFIPTETGIGYFDVHSFNGMTFNYADGLPAQVVTTKYFSYDSSDRTIWFACKNILCRLPAIANANYFQPPVLNIADLAINNDSVINYPSAQISLRHNQNVIKISLSAINFSDPQNMRFAYRIKNISDTTWTDMGNQQNILLTNISPGTYRIQAKVYAFDNKWPGQTKEIEINILPPFWKTSWFLALVILIVAGSAYFLYRKRINSLKQKTNLDKLLAQTEMKALHSQMNPHFIFNSLNSIMQMVMNDEKMNAGRYLSNYAQLVRMNLEHSQRNFITLRENIDYLQLYLDLEKIRTNNFVHSLELDEGLNPDEILLPPMLIQPFIENAIWYGPSNTHIPMKLDIRFSKKKDQLLCIVEDNGIGIDASMKIKNEKTVSYTSMGINNVRQRIRILNEKYRLNYSFVIEDKSRLNGGSESGTIVILGLPLNFSY
jgi:ligand-binding sensor domain-containing protein